MELDKYLGKLFQQRSIGRTLETPSCPDGSEPVAVVRSPLAAGRSEALQPEAPLAPPDDEETARVRQV